MLNLENVNSSEKAESNYESQEQLAEQKFNEIFDYVLANRGLKIYKDEDKIQGNLDAFDDGEGNKFLSILWGNTGDGNNTIYQLRRDNDGQYNLLTNYEHGNEQYINNLTVEELFNTVLPNFERRLNEGKMFQQQQRQKALEDANQYAYQQDQQDADRLLQENGLV